MAEEKFPMSKPKSEKVASERDYPEIEEMKQRIEKLESQLEREQAPEKKGEIARQEIKSYLQELQQTPSFAPSPSTRDEAEEIAKFEPDQQVGSLISLVFEKGLSEAVSVARALDNPAILDEFHDALVDHYYQTMIEKKILKF